MGLISAFSGEEEWTPFELIVLAVRSAFHETTALPGRQDDEGVTGGGGERLRAAAAGRKRIERGGIREDQGRGGARSKGAESINMTP